METLDSITKRCSGLFFIFLSYLCLRHRKRLRIKRAALMSFMGMLPKPSHKERRV
jgi:hypothetical protein